ncbi:hypothetical protein [Paenibacillus rhizovicinus]|uniref:hypothetical protein n=1 Tax=Paenibacillus rhizovicinus TaxID=2704463 RepID=UPI0021F08663|nr:hypothetical protein [Paenibacillus rhizovicinus]
MLKDRETIESIGLEQLVGMAFAERVLVRMHRASQNGLPTQRSLFRNIFATHYYR